MSISQSILSNWMGLFVNGLISFLLTPVLVHGLGDMRYGMWILAASVLDYLGLLDLGMRATLFRFTARFDPDGDRVALNETLVSALSVTLAIAAGVILATCALAGILPKFFALEAAEVETFRYVLLLLGTGAAITFPAYLLGTYLCARRRFDLYNLAAIVTGSVRAVLVVLVLWMGGGVVGIAAGTLAVTALSLMLYERMVRHVDPAVSLDLRLARWDRVLELSRFSAFAFLNGFGELLRFYTSPVVIGRTLGIGAVTPFSIAFRLLYLFRQIIVAMASPFMAGMSVLDAQGRDEELRLFFLRASTITATCSLLLGTHILLNGRSLIYFWMGDTFGVSYEIALVLTIGYVVALGQQPTVDIVLVRGQHRLRGWLSLGEGIANVLLSLHWARRYGLIGVALGTAVPMLVSHVLIQPWYALHVVGLSAGRYLREALLRPLLVSVTFLGMAWLATGGRPPDGVLQFLGRLVWETVAFAALAWLLVLRADERARARGRVRAWLGALGLGHVVG